MDFGPFSEGETVTIDASQFVSAGDDDGIKLKSPKDEIGTIPKKHLKLNDGQDSNIHVEVSDSVAGAIKNLDDVETLLKDDDKINKKEISTALGKLKSFKDALDN